MNEAQKTANDLYDEGFSRKRLGTTDEKGNRVYLHPIDVKGKWRKIRKIVYWVLIGIYLLLPWVYINGKQIILLNLPAREFYIFGTTFYGHDAPLSIFLFLGFIFLVSFVTALWGRVWCGYACPQTVFIDSIFRPIEALIEGTPRKRQKLDSAPWNFEKIWKRSLKWLLFLLVSLHIVHSFLGYFVGTRNLVNITLHSPQDNMTLFITMLVMTGIILLDFGWFREQFCIIACPYGRFQSLVMDENSLIVAYDEKRGEPRKAKGVAAEDEGDCVSCGMCVKACPTGIDIRDGLQMECIACTMCIDACDDIMVRVKKPKGLIRYSTGLKLKGLPAKISPRVYIYFALFVAAMIGLSSALYLRQNLKTQVLRGSKSPYQVISKQGSESKIVNHIKLKLSYYKTEKTKLKLVQNFKDGAPKIDFIVPQDIIEFDADNIEANVFFTFKPEILEHGLRIIHLDLVDVKTGEVHKTIEVKLVGPLN